MKPTVPTLTLAAFTALGTAQPTLAFGSNDLQAHAFFTCVYSPSGFSYIQARFAKTFGTRLGFPYTSPAAAEHDKPTMFTLPCLPSSKKPGPLFTPLHEDTQAGTITWCIHNKHFVSSGDNLLFTPYFLLTTPTKPTPKTLPTHTHDGIPFLTVQSDTEGRCLGTS